MTQRLSSQTTLTFQIKSATDTLGPYDRSSTIITRVTRTTPVHLRHSSSQVFTFFPCRVLCFLGVDTRDWGQAARSVRQFPHRSAFCRMRVISFPADVNRAGLHTSASLVYVGWREGEIRRVFTLHNV